MSTNHANSNDSNLSVTMLLAHAPTSEPIAHYKTLQLIAERLTPRTAKDVFDALSRVYPVAGFGAMRQCGHLLPDDRTKPMRLRYSYTWDDFAAKVGVPEKHYRLVEAWDLILKDASRQPFMTGPANIGPRSFDFYRFVAPEVHLIPAPPPIPGKPFELRWSTGSDRHFFNHYVGT